MKCVRNIGWDMKYSVWHAECKQAHRKIRKTQKYDIVFLCYDLPRYRMRRRALDMINNTNLYWHTRERLIHKYVQNGGINNDSKRVNK